jgi:hypothetical protein
MLSKYKKEEDENFKNKFETLVAVEETRTKIKEEINNARYGTSKENQGDGQMSNRYGENEDFKSGSVIIKRTRSHMILKKPETAKQILKTRDMIEKVLDHNSRRHFLMKKDYERQEVNLLKEIDELQKQIQRSKR